MGIGSCQLIGSTSMVVRCAELVLEHGGQVAGLVSDVEVARRWAAEHDVPQISLRDDLQHFLELGCFDHLFSVVNPVVLGAEVLALPPGETINFHDGPLPRYAGCHATSWAIFNGETRHGVTWHRMTSLVDGGDIVRQEDVPITPRDTAFTLNIKCYDAGIKAFSQLLDELAEGTLSPVPQDLSERTFFAAGERPGPATLSWAMPATATARLVRALDCGPGRTDLDRPGISTPSGWTLEVRTAEALPDASTHRPGTVLETGDGWFSVATATQDLVLRGLHDPSGRSSVDVVGLHDHFCVREGVVLGAAEA